MKALLHDLRASLLLTFVFGVLLCGAYPLLVWAGAQALFPTQANGSLLRDKAGTVIGSALLAQNFSSDKYFQPRASAAGTGYDATSSGGTNYGPTSQKLNDSIKAAVAAYRTANGMAADAPVPADAVTSSASGLDPDITPNGALFQVPRVAAARGLPEDQLRQLVQAHVETRLFGLIGEPHVNVLKLNLALDALQGS